MKKLKNIKSQSLILQETILNKILFIRGKKVLLDRDLANLYGVKTSRLNEQVKRNIKRFPNDFMFQLTKIELQNWISQFATSKKEIMGLRKPPFAFTEQGVAMLSSVLNSNKAIEVNIQIMRTFIKLKEMLSTHRDLKRKIEEMEKKYDYQFKEVFQAIKYLISEKQKPKTQIGFIKDNKK